MLLRLGIGAGFAAALVASFFAWKASHDADLRKEERAKAVLEITQALQEAESRDVANAETAERELPPTPDDVIALIAICNQDKACRNRGQQ